jgi:hypothetical protein
MLHVSYITSNIRTCLYYISSTHECMLHRQLVCCVYDLYSHKKMTTFCDTSLYDLVEMYRRFIGVSYIHHQGEEYHHCRDSWHL